MFLATKTLRHKGSQSYFLNAVLCLSAFVVFFFILIASSCSNPENTNTTRQSTTSSTPISSVENFEKGKVLLNIKCKADTTNSYTLYIPTSYAGSSPFPVILFFDPHASGAFPIKKYQALAEKHGFIIAGSNNSKNGNSAEVNGAFAGNLLNDVQARMNIDTKRIYASGFSGGSRVASYMAIFRGGINTVIGCGAGLPNIDKPIENKFNYVGIAGNEDFNYTEMEDLENMLSKSDVEHIFIPFNGKHEWCPVEVMEQVFIWIKLKAMKQFIIPKNDSIINAYVTTELNKLDELLKNKKEGDAFVLAKQVINFTSGLITNDKLNTTYTQLEGSCALKKAQARKEELSKAEKALKDQYLNALAVKDVAWWKTETQHLNDTKRFPPDQVVMNKRILSFMSLACYMSTTQMLRNSQVNEAEHFISVYKIVDPENAEAPYLQATIYLSKNENNKALLELNSAAKLGFKEYDRFVKDFPALATTKQAEPLIAIIKANVNKDQE
jgi:predicted esterase